jgi:hypothetical protein
MNALPQYDHCHEVYKKAAKAEIVDESVIRNKREDSERRRANVTLRRLALVHSLDYSELKSSGERLPPLLRDSRVMEELEIFSKLTELERSGAPRSAYASILNNGRRPLALLVKLADYAVTHDTENQLEGFIADGTPSLIRRYSSVEDAYSAMRADAKAGEMIYAPVAELFGYPQLAGDIFLHSFRVNHPEIYNHVLSSMRDPSMKDRIARTQRMVGELAKVLTGHLKSSGFDAEVTLRREKHDGKKMKKVLSHLSDDYGRSAEKAGGMKFPEYVARKIGFFDFERFNDLVAVRVVVHSYHGASMDEVLSEAAAVENGSTEGRYEGVGLDKIGQMLESIKASALRIAVSDIANVLSTVRDRFGEFVGNARTNAVYYEKKNGYRAFHFDTKSDKDGAHRALPFEVQLKTPEWHAIAEHGKAAHYYYLSRDEEHAPFVDMIAAAYHDIIHPPDKSSPANGAPASRRPSLPPSDGKEGAGTVTPRRTL